MIFADLFYSSELWQNFYLPKIAGGAQGQFDVSFNKICPIILFLECKTLLTLNYEMDYSDLTVSMNNFHDLTE